MDTNFSEVISGLEFHKVSAISVQWNVFVVAGAKQEFIILK